jgi:SLT domain-containing protein
MASLYERISKGKISVDEITASMERSTAKGGKYFQSMEKQSQTFSGRLSTLKDNLSQFLGTLTTGITATLADTVIPKISETIEKMSAAFKSGGVSGLLSMFGSVGAAVQGIINKIQQLMANKEAVSVYSTIFSDIKTAASAVVKTIGNIIGKVIEFLGQQGTLNAIKESWGLIKTAVNGVWGAVKKVLGFLIDNLPIIAPLVMTVVTALGAFKAIMLVIKGVQLAYAAVQAIVNAAMLACPITWIVAAIAALIGIIVACVVNWDKLKAAGTKCWKAIKSAFSSAGDWFNSKVVKPIAGFFSNLWDKVTDGAKSVKNSITGIWKDTVKAVAKPVNKVIGGANWILDKLGSDKKIDEWKPYARGTKGHKGGNALVNDGSGAEMVQMPNGYTFIPKGRNVYLPNAPKGMKVLDAKKTAQIMGKNSPTFHYKDGIGFDVFDFFDNAKGLVSKVIDKFVNYKGMSGYVLNAGKAIVSKIKGAMPSWVKKLFNKFGGKDIASYKPSEGVNQWKSTVKSALKMEKQYSAANLKRTLYQMQTESGGNPRAINRWDSNAKKGTPSKGLMQVIDPTFKSNARKGYDKNIYDPMSNILASIRYAVSRYGSLAKAYQGHGYANGGLVTKAGWIGEGNKDEMVIPLSSGKRKRAMNLWQQTGNMIGAYTPDSDVKVRGGSVEYNSYSPSFELTISGTNDDRAMARKVKRWINDAMNEAFDSMERKSSRLQEV